MVRWFDCWLTFAILLIIYELLRGNLENGTG
jgi:hypothetical protein